MRRTIRTIVTAIGIVVSLAMLTALIAVLAIMLDSWADVWYLSVQLDCAPDGEEVESTFQGLFYPGKPQEEVYGILLELDPQLSGQLGADLRCMGSLCCETLMPFRERMGPDFGHVFCYDTEMNLLSVSLFY